jgi:hypothetical protein
MPSFLRPECYHKSHTRQQLLLILPAEQVDEQLAILERCQLATFLPYEDVAEPYLHLVKCGHVLTERQLRQLLQWSVRLVMTFEQFVQWYVLPFALQGGRGLVSELNQILFTPTPAAA